MTGRSFLDVARDVVAGASEAYWRAAAVHAYYALMLEGRAALFRWGLVLPRRDNVHTWVRLRFDYAADPDVKRIGEALDRLVKLRNQASYNLSPSPQFSSDAHARKAIQDATTALALLDAIEADPVRRAAAIAAIRP